ncbi:tRNA lysidine(34) synthetase TilS [Psychromarinibacter sp. C21-152]|uniref:tRNA(Ile)-lysidine synthase n=1 Tax=Psychromarinibacter sediminicola TaxID=3033385 RepID=A0AAE3NPV7_9RHOB|nr:tRNA lysidine(34) synthetase TilS [Psychromarinibacter sediminicola]MDF0599847.1 tRNA lysidine(34) synthetase TilS [Psychromarinibacter sediminicola]
MSHEPPLAERLRGRVAGRIAPNAPSRLGVAVSGGGDSLALLDLLMTVTGPGVPLEAVTVDHGLRPEARDEAAHVAALCARWGVPHETLRWDGGGERGNLMANARAARYRLIADWAGRRGIGAVALGHTADDVAETFLMRLARASGIDGLATMRARFELHGLSWLRPLLDIRRTDLRAYLKSRGIAWCDDPTNADLRYDRARTRQIVEVLTPLGIDAGTLGRVADNMAAARDALQHYARIEAPRCVRVDRGDVLLDRAPDPPVPAEIDRRLLVAALIFVSGADYPPRESSLTNLRAALARQESHTICGCHVSHAPDGRLRITREWNAVKDLAGPADALWDGRWRLTGPHAPELEVRALGEAVSQCPNRRTTGLPRPTLLASPSVWRGNALISAPLAGMPAGWTAELDETRCEFVASVL